MSEQFIILQGTHPAAEAKLGAEHSSNYDGGVMLLIHYGDGSVGGIRTIELADADRIRLAEFLLRRPIDPTATLEGLGL